MINDLAGFVTGVAGLGLFALGLLVALLRKPAKGWIARGIAAGGLVLALCGALLFTVEEVAPFRRTTDDFVSVLSGAAFLLAIWAGVRCARRRPGPKGTDQAPAEGAEPSEPAGP
jgi:hypothetical protein